MPGGCSRCRSHVLGPASLSFCVRHLMRIFLLSVIAVLVTSCSYSVRYRSPQVSAIAVDKDTDKPISGLTVTVTWNALLHTNLHTLEGNGMIMDIHSATTVTDTNGAFVIPAWGPVSHPSSWRYFRDDPTVSFSKSGRNLGYWDNEANGSNWEDTHALPFQTVDFGKPSWDGQKLKLPQWKLEKPLW